MIDYVILLLCLFLIGIRTYLCYKVEYNIILVTLYPFTVMFFIVISIGEIIGNEDKFEQKIIYVIMVIGIGLFLISLVASIMNIYKQIKKVGLKMYFNNNKFYILFSIGAIITVAPGAMAALGIPFIDLALLFNKNMRK